MSDAPERIGLVGDGFGRWSLWSRQDNAMDSAIQYIRADIAAARIEADGKLIAELDRALRWIRDNPGAHWHTVVEVADRALLARLEGGEHR